MGLFDKNYMKYFPEGFKLKTRLSSKVSEYKLYNNDQSTQWFIIGEIVNGELVISGTENGYTWGSWILFNQFNEELKKLYTLKNYCETIGVNLAGLDLSSGWLATRDDIIAGWSVEDNTANRQIYDDIFLRYGFSTSPEANLLEKVIGFWQWLLGDLDSAFDSGIERDNLISATIPSKMYDSDLVNTVKGDNDVIADAVMNTGQNYGGISAEHEFDLSDMETSIEDLNEYLFGSRSQVTGLNYTYDILPVMLRSNGHCWIYRLRNTHIYGDYYLVSSVQLTSDKRTDPWVGYKDSNDPTKYGLYKNTGMTGVGNSESRGLITWVWFTYNPSTARHEQSTAFGLISGTTYPLYLTLGYADPSVVTYSGMQTFNGLLPVLAGIDVTDPSEYEVLFENQDLTWELIVDDNQWGFTGEGASSSSNSSGLRDPYNSDGSLASQVGAGIIAGAMAGALPLFGENGQGGFISTDPSIVNKDDALDYLDDLAKNTGFYVGEPDEYLPDFTWTGNKLFTIWNLEDTDFTSLGNYLWTKNNWDMSHLFNTDSPLDSIISLTAYPFSFPSIPANKIPFHMAGETFNNVLIEALTRVIYTKDCGSISIKEYFKNFLDYDPFTKVTAYLPFIGFVNLNVDDLMGASSIQLKYRIELFSGNCLATITVKRPNFKVCFYQFSGNCGINIPLSGSRHSNALLGMLAGAGGVAGATMGAMSANPAMMIGGMGVAGNSVSELFKHEPVRSGAMQGNVGMLGNMQPYIIIERKVPRNSEAYSSLNGRPSTDYKSLGQCSGFVRMSNFKLYNLKCNDSQKNMIDDLLRNGVFID